MDPHNITDQIISQAASGDRQAFESIYRAFGDMVYRVVYRVLNHEQDSEEVTQDVFVKIYKELKNFRSESSLKTWIYRIAINTALNYRKKRARYEREVGMDESVMDYVNKDSVSPDAMHQEDHDRMIQKLLSHLNPDQRACIILRSIEKLSYEEIADSLGVNINTVRTRLKRAREKLLAIKNEVINSDL